MVSWDSLTAYLQYHHFNLFLKKKEKKNPISFSAVGLLTPQSILSYHIMGFSAMPMKKIIKDTLFQLNACSNFTGHIFSS